MNTNTQADTSKLSDEQLDAEFLKIISESSPKEREDIRQIILEVL